MNLPIVLVGYPGSQRVIKASKYLINKYLPGFGVIHINYTGKIEGWSEFILTVLSYLSDEYIIFSLDDYLIANHIDISKYNSAFEEIGGDVVCIKLCQSTPEEHDEYPVTTQYTIWKREYLMQLLRKVKTPWEFEIIGSRLFDKTVLHRHCLDYFTNSSISGRWEGVRLDGLKDEDIKYIKENGLIS